MRKIAEQTDLDLYFRDRVEPLAKRILDVAEDLLGKKSAKQQREFESHVEKRIQNGAKFIPRKR